MIIDSKKYSGSCSCGRNHEMFTRMAVIEAGCLAEFDRYLAELGLVGKRAAIYDENTYHAKGLVRPAVAQEIILDPHNLHANEQATEAILAQLAPDVQLLVAVGSGTIHDSTRYCAHKLGIPFVACPTAASVDGFCSTVSAMTWGGNKKTMPGVAPALVLADTNVIQQAPIALALSGVGDILGKFTSLADWKIAHIVTGEFICPVIEDMTRQAVVAVKECCEQIRQGGDPAAFEHLTYGLLLSGLAMQMMGNSRPASAAEHHISHLIEVEPVSLGLHSTALHGEKVGVGTAIVSAEYHRLAAIEDIAPYILPYQPLTAQLLYPDFGPLTESILEENAEDSMGQVNPARLAQCWGEIRQVIEEIPTEQELLALYTLIGAKKTLADIEVDEALLPQLLHLAPCIRNRLTLLRIRRMLRVSHTNLA